MERLEEGLTEHPPDMNQHVRVSEYLKRKPASEESPTDQSILGDTAVSTMINEIDNSDDKIANRVSEGLDFQNSNEQPGYSKIDDSFFVHAKPQENDPVVLKPMSEYKNTIYENLFGSNITVTKLLNRETGKEKIISKHK